MSRSWSIACAHQKVDIVIEIFHLQFDAGRGGSDTDIAAHVHVRSCVDETAGIRGGFEPKRLFPHAIGVKDGQRPVVVLIAVMVNNLRIEVDV
jgi:hypothetical protein